MDELEGDELVVLLPDSADEEEAGVSPIHDLGMSSFLTGTLAMFASWICEGIPEPTASPAEALMLILPGSRRTDG
jgi:hypothetical protein